ncbi:hypothetical protein LEN26_015726 [Aphanomyces euteiches]|nr:hypothetical protein LEN26_015726 [Aphanomyces euteiches]
MQAKVCRHQHSILEKRTAISRVQAGETQRAVAEAMSIKRNTLQKWISHPQRILDYKGSQKHKKIGNTGRKEIIPCATELVNHMTTIRSEEKPLSASHMIQFLKQHVPEWYSAYVESKQANKTAYKTLLRLLERFSLRHGFSRQCATLAKMPQADLDALHAEFGAAFHREYLGFDDDTIYNVDETGMYYDMSSKIIWAIRGGSSKISGGDKHAYRTTAVLTVRADGVKLPILFVIKGVPGGTIDMKELDGYPKGHFYAVQERAWMNKRVWEMYLWNVFAPSVEGPSVLFVDNFDSHVSDASYRIVQEEVGCHLAALPPNSTSHCQPLDVSLVGPFKQHLRDLFLAESEVCLTCADKRLVMINRAIMAWELITEDEVRASFTKALPKPALET